MSIPEAEVLVATLASEGEKLADGAVTDLFDEARDLIDSEADGELAKAGHEALDLIDANRDPFLRLTKIGFARIVGHFGSGDEEAAMNAYMATKATYAERRRWMQEGGDRAFDAAKEAREAWQAVKDVLVKVGSLGLKFLVKAAMTAIAIV